MHCSLSPVAVLTMTVKVQYNAFIVFAALLLLQIPTCIWRAVCVGVCAQ